MNNEMLESMKDAINEVVEGIPEIEKTACYESNDAICKKTWDIWDSSNEVSSKANEILDSAAKKLIADIVHAFDLRIFSEDKIVKFLRKFVTEGSKKSHGELCRELNLYGFSSVFSFLIDNGYFNKKTVKLFSDKIDFYKSIEDLCDSACHLNNLTGNLLNTVTENSQGFYDVIKSNDFIMATKSIPLN